MVEHLIHDNVIGCPAFVCLGFASLLTLCLCLLPSSFIEAFFFSLEKKIPLACTGGEANAKMHIYLRVVRSAQQILVKLKLHRIDRATTEY